VCVCSLRYPACCPFGLLGCTTFFLISYTGELSKKKLLSIKYVLSFSATFCLKHFSFRKNSARCCHKCLHVKYSLFLSDFNETWISSTDFERRHSNIKLHENPYSGSWVVPFGQTDRWSLFAVLRTRRLIHLTLVLYEHPLAVFSKYFYKFTMV